MTTLLVFFLAAAVLFAGGAQPARGQATLSTATVKQWGNSIKAQVDNFVVTELQVPVVREAVRNVTRVPLTKDIEALRAELADELSKLALFNVELCEKIAKNATHWLRTNGGAQDGAYYDASSTNLPPDMAQDSSFFTRTSRTSSTVKFAPTANKDAPTLKREVTWTGKLDPLFRENLQNYSDIAWQSIGTVNGLYRSFPGTQWSSDGSGGYSQYDPRWRGWFVEARTGPKNLIFVIDSSGSMEQEDRLKIAKKSVETLINQCSLNDYIYLITFSDEAKSTVSCFTKTQQATPAVKQTLISSMQYVQPQGGTDFEKAFELAFEVLNRSNTGAATRCQTGIIFLTDGISTDPTPIINKAKQNNIGGQNGEDLHIFSFTMGALSDPSIPQKIACENKGIYGAVRANGDLQTSLSSYSSYMGKGQEIWSAPYIDILGLGLMVSRAVPVYDPRGDLAAVALLDMTLDVISQSVLDFTASHFSEDSAYAFIVYQDGTGLVHPKLNVRDNPSLFDITELETAGAPASQIPAEFAAMRMSLLRGETGQRTMLMPRAVSRGETTDGLEVLLVNTTYFYGPIAYSDFFLAVAVPEQRLEDNTCTDTPAGWSAAMNGQTTYHDLETVKNNVAGFASMNIENVPATDQLRPSPNGIKIVRDRLGYQVPLSAYCDPVGAKKDGQTVSGTTDVTGFVSSAGANPGCEGDKASQGLWKKEVLGEVRLTGLLADVWLQQAVSPDVMWKYMAMERSGSFQLWPASDIPVDFDARQRGWYLRTLLAGDDSTSVVSPPYADVETGATVTTFSRRISVPAPNGTGGSESIQGVVALDTPYTSFENTLTGIFDSDCNSPTKLCVVLDDASRFVYPEIVPLGAGNDARSLGEYSQVLLDELVKAGIYETTFGRDFSSGCPAKPGYSSPPLEVDEESPGDRVEPSILGVSLATSPKTGQRAPRYDDEQHLTSRQAVTLTDCAQDVISYRFVSSFAGEATVDMTPSPQRPEFACVSGNVVVSRISGTNLLVLTVSNLQKSATTFNDFDGKLRPCPVTTIPKKEEVVEDLCTDTVYERVERPCAALFEDFTCDIDCPDDCNEEGDCINGKCLCTFEASEYDTDDCSDPDAGSNLGPSFVLVAAMLVCVSQALAFWR